MRRAESEAEPIFNPAAVAPPAAVHAVYKMHEGVYHVRSKQILSASAAAAAAAAAAVVATVRAAVGAAAAFGAAAF